MALFREIDEKTPIIAFNMSYNFQRKIFVIVLAFSYPFFIFLSCFLFLMVLSESQKFKSQNNDSNQINQTNTSNPTPSPTQPVKEINAYANIIGDISKLNVNNFDLKIKLSKEGEYLLKKYCLGKTIEEKAVAKNDNYTYATPVNLEECDNTLIVIVEFEDKVILKSEIEKTDSYSTRITDLSNTYSNSTFFTDDYYKFISFIEMNSVDVLVNLNGNKLFADQYSDDDILEFDIEKSLLNYGYNYVNVELSANEGYTTQNIDFKLYLNDPNFIYFEHSNNINNEKNIIKVNALANWYPAESKRFLYEKFDHSWGLDENYLIYSEDAENGCLFSSLPYVIRDNAGTDSTLPDQRSIIKIDDIDFFIETLGNITPDQCKNHIQTIMTNYEKIDL